MFFCYSVSLNCGKELSADFAKHEEKEAEEETSYETLSPSVQRELKREFNSEYPQYAKYEDREPFYKKLKIISWIVLALCVVSAYIMYKQENIPMIVVTVILLLISYGYDLYCPIAIRNNKKKQLRILKLYAFMVVINHIERVIIFYAASARNELFVIGYRRKKAGARTSARQRACFAVGIFVEKCFFYFVFFIAHIRIILLFYRKVNKQCEKGYFL